MKPAIPIHDPRFRYTPSHRTDLADTFARVRWERARAGQQERRVQAPTLVVDRVDAVSKARR